MRVNKYELHQNFIKVRLSSGFLLVFMVLTNLAVFVADGV
jgi:hypothetical protein